MKRLPLAKESNGKFILPGDGWYQLAPVGDHPVNLQLNEDTGLNHFGTRHTKAMQVIDEQALSSIVASLEGEALIDYEHHSHDPEGDTVAAGWITKLTSRPEGLYFRVRWSRATEDIESGRYRYISPVWFPADCEVISSTDEHILVRPLRLADAGLTNRPNLLGLAPLTNRQGLLPSNPHPTDTMKLKDATILALLTALGLKETATDDDVLAALPNVQTALQEREQLLQDNATLLEAQAEADLDRHSAVITNSQRPLWKKMLLANRADSLAALEGLAPVSTSSAPITNRATAKTPASAAVTPTEAASEKKAAAIRNRATELRRSNPALSLTASYAQAEAELAG